VGARPGISVVEVLVALMLVTIGLLGVAGSSALALRSQIRSGGERHAVRLAANRFAAIAAAGCATAGGSATDTVRQATEWWTVAPVRNGFATVRDSVEWMSARGTRTLAVESAVPC
jgi:Tfp pilus assembly protein PilV